MKILAVDTSAVAASAALWDDGHITGEFFINTKLTHSRTLIPMIDALLKNTDMSVSDLDAVAVNAGPGSFTGVRIGVAAVKGIAFPDNLACISVSTLESMAYNMLYANCVVCCVMDARCSQVYNANFRVSGNSIERLCDDRALSIEELTQELKKTEEQIILAGDGAELCYNSMKEILNNIALAPINQRIQRASSTAIAAAEKYKNNQTLTPAQLMPLYLRLPQAQRELKKKLEEDNK